MTERARVSPIERLRNRLTQRTVFGIIDDHRRPRDGLKRYPMQTDCAAERANSDNTSKATNHAAEPSESVDIRQSPQAATAHQCGNALFTLRSPFNGPALGGATATFLLFQVAVTN